MTHKPMTQDEVLAVLGALDRANTKGLEMCNAHQAYGNQVLAAEWRKMLTELEQARATIAAWNVSPSADVVDAELRGDLDHYLVGCPDPSKVPGWLVNKASRLLWRCRAQLAQQGGESKDG